MKIRLAVMVAAIFSVGCNDLLTDAQKVEPAAPPAGDSTQVATRFQAITCTVTLADKKVVCGEPVRAPGGVDADLVVGGQHIGFEPSNESFLQDATTKTFRMDVAVRNLLVKQTLGTTDGVTPDPRGVRVFLASGPVAKSGTGAVTVGNEDGIGTFTASLQPYWQYNSMVSQYQATVPKTWIFTTGINVTSFMFTAYVSAPVRFPDGWVDITPAVFPLKPTTTWKLTGTVRDVVGDPVLGAPIVWGLSDPTRASLAADGTVTGIVCCATTVTATSGVRSGTSTLNVSPTLRTWTAGAATTDYRTNGNWSPAIVPAPEDTILIPFPSSLYPALAANETVAGITVQDQASFNLGAFDLTSTGFATAGTTAGITNTSGRLMLVGTAKTMQGRLSRVRVTGTYTLTGNVTARAPFEVLAGRVTNGTFRLQAESN